MTKSDEETVDYVGNFGFHAGFCGLGQAFSSDYMPLLFCNSAFSSFSELSVDLQFYKKHDIFTCMHSKVVSKTTKYQETND